MTDVNDTEFWSNIYQAGTTGWDLGGPTPVFCALAEGGAYPAGKMLVLGAGRGYDARTFARHGFTVTAVDFAPEAIRDMQALAEKNAPVVAIRADLFKLPTFFKNHFDYVLEYVTYCAIDPARRGEYVRAVADALAPGGLFIGLVFPLGDHTDGPPFAVSPDKLIEDFEQLGFTLIERGFRKETIEPRFEREELVIMRKA